MTIFLVVVILVIVAFIAGMFVEAKNHIIGR